MKTPSEILNEAADLLEKPGAWTQGAYARGADGAVVEMNSPKAACMCTEGALYRTCHGAPYAFEEVFETLERVVGDPSIARWNDAPERTQAEVVAALRQAAQQAPASPQDIQEAV